MRIITINGHRPNAFGGYDPNNPFNLKIRSVLDTLVTALKLKYEGQLKLISGGALGVDQWAMESAVGAGVSMTIAIPFKGFESKWPEKSQKHFHELCQKAGKIYYVSEEVGYDAKLMLDRNIWMIDNSDYLISVFSGQKKTGTSHAVWYAKRKGVAVIVIDPAAIQRGDYDRCLQYIDGQYPAINKEIRSIKLHNVPAMPE